MAGANNINEERELIKKAKRGDIEAMKKIHIIYRGLVSKAIKDSGAELYMDRSMLELEARRIIEKLVQTRLDSSAETQPSTFIYSSLANAFRTLKNNSRNEYARSPEEISRKSAIVNPVYNDLKRELGREPTDAEIYKEIDNRRKMKSNYARDFKLSDVKKVRDMARTNIIGNKLIGGPDSEGAPITSAENLMQSRVPTAESLYQRQQEEANINSIILRLNLTRDERRAVYSFAGIGEFKDKKAPNIHQAALNGRITDYRLKQIIGMIGRELGK